MFSLEPILPRAVRATNLHRNARVVDQLLVQRQLTALVVGHALAHRLCNAEHVWDLPMPDLSFASGYTFVVCMAQGFYQVLLELPNGLGGNAVINGLD